MVLALRTATFVAVDTVRGGVGVAIVTRIAAGPAAPLTGVSPQELSGLGTRKLLLSP